MGRGLTNTGQKPVNRPLLGRNFEQSEVLFMKLFNRVLAMALALIMSFAVLPLGIFASEPAIKVESETVAPSGSGDTSAKVVVKVNAKKLAEILKDTGLSKNLLSELKSHITVDLGSLLDFMSIDEVLRIIPIEDIFTALDIEKIINELGDKVDVYFDLNALLASLTEEEIDALIDADDALPIILDYYENEDPNGLAGLLEELLLASEDDMNNGPVRVHALAQATFWNKNCFVDSLHDFDVAKYITYEDHHVDGKVNVDELLEYWEKDQNGKFEVGFLQIGDDPVTGAKSDIKIDILIEDAHNAGVPIENYFHLEALIDDAEAFALIKDLIKNEPEKYLTAAGKAKVDAWVDNAVNGAHGDALKKKVEELLDGEIDKIIDGELEEAVKEIVEANIDWETDIELPWLENFLGVTGWDAVRFELLDDAKLASVKAAAKADPKGVMKPEAYDRIEAIIYDEVYDEVEAAVRARLESELSDSVREELEAEFESAVLTKENLETLTIDDFVIMEVFSATKNIIDYHDFFEVDNFIHDEMPFFIQYRTDFLTDAGLDKIFDHVDFISMAVEVITIDKIIETEGLETLMSWIDFEATLDEMEAAGKSITDYINTVAAIEIIGVDRLLSIIKESGTDITTLVDINALIDAVGLDALFAQLTVDEIMEIAKLPCVKAALPQLLTVVANKLLYNIDEVTINGVVVAQEDTAGFGGKLLIDMPEIVKALSKLIPTLNELATLEGDVLLQGSFGFTYQQDPTPDYSINENVDPFNPPAPVTKEFVLQVVLDGGAEQVRQAASKLRDLLDRYIKYDFNDGILDLDVNIPAKAATLYAKVLQSARVNNTIKQKLLAITSATGEDAIGLLHTLTVDELIQVLTKVDTDVLYDKFMQIKYTEKVIDLIAKKTGKDFSGITINEVVALLDDAIDKAGSKALVDKIYNIIESKTGIDVTTVLEDKDFTDLNDRVAAERDLLEKGLKKVFNYVDLVADKIETLAPALLHKSIGDLYKGDGSFGAGVDAVKEVHVRYLADRVLRKLLEGKANIPEELYGYVLDFFPESLTMKAGVDLTVHFEDIYRVTYHNANSEVIFEAFLPVGANLSVYTGYNPSDIVVDGWRLADGTPITSMPGADVDVYPVIIEDPLDLYATVTFLDGDGSVLAVFDKLKGEAFGATSIPTPIKIVVGGYEYIYEWVHNGWYLATDENKTRVNINSYVVTDDVTFVPSFYARYFDAKYGPHTEVVGNAFVIETNTLFAGNKQTVVLSQQLVAAATKAGSTMGIALKGNGVEVTIDNATIRQLADLGSYVAFSYEKNASFSVSYYNQGNADQYTFDFLCGNNPDNLKSYTALLTGSKNFAGVVTFKLPFTTIATIANTQGTHVYYTDDKGTATTADDTRTLISASIAADAVTFEAKHFSDFTIANEYYVDMKFESLEPNEARDLQGVWGLDRHYFPVGATITIAPEITNYTYVTREVVVTTAGFAGTVTNNGNGTWTISTMPAQAITVVAKVEYAVFYNVIFKVDGVEYKRVIVKDGYKLVLPADYVDPTKAPIDTAEERTAYTFEYWTDANGARVDLSNLTVSGGDVVLDAYFSANTEYAVTFNYKDASYADQAETIWIKKGDAIASNADYLAFVQTLPTYTLTNAGVRETFGFNGKWNGTAGLVDITAGLTGALTLTAGYDVTLTEYFVTFNYKDASFADQTFTLWIKKGDRIGANADYLAFVAGLPTYTLTNAGVRETFTFDGTWNNGLTVIDLAAGVQSVLTLTANYDVTLTEYLVTFNFNTVENGVDTIVTKTIWIVSGTKITAAEYASLKAGLDIAKADPTGDDYYLFSYAFNDKWSVNGSAPVAFENLAAITGVTVLDIAFDQVFYAADNDTEKYTVEATIGANGEYVVTVTVFNPNHELTDLMITLNAKIKEYVEDKGENAKWNVVVNDVNGEYTLLSVNYLMLQKLYANADELGFSFAQADTFAHGHYNNGNAEKYSFDFLLDGVSYATKMANDLAFVTGSVEITLPFACTPLAEFGTGRTRVYHVQGGLIYITSRPSADLIRFYAPHFSDFVVANEYQISTHVTHGDMIANQVEASATWVGLNADGFYPEGATITLQFKDVPAHYFVARVTDGTANLVKSNDTTWTFNTSAQGMTLTAVLMPVEYTITYYVADATGYKAVRTVTYTIHGILRGEKDAVLANHEAALASILADQTLETAKKGKVSTWIGFDADKISATAPASMNVYLTFDAIEYTVNFMYGETKQDSITFTIDDVKANLRPILFVNVPGMLASSPAWDAYASTEEIVDAMIAAGVTEMDLDVVYTVCSYDVIFNSNEAKVTVNGVEIAPNTKLDYGTKFQIAIAQKAHYNAAFKVYYNDIEAESYELVADENGFYTMPASNVTVIVTYTAVPDVVYTINGINKTGALGDVVTFKVELAPGYRVANMSTVCTLISTKVDNNKYILEYQFTIDREGINVTYTVEPVNYDGMNIFNGTEHTGPENPFTTEDKVSFGGWGNATVGGIKFAIFDVDTALSLLWLWILLAIALIVAIIAILYKVYMTGKFKPNFVFRFVAWIVSGFFAVCAFVATVGLYILSIFGKTEEDFDYLSDDLVEDEEEELLEETAEEATEEVTEEATEEAAEEATEEKAEETAEETSEDEEPKTNA